MKKLPTFHAKINPFTRQVKITTKNKDFEQVITFKDLDEWRSFDYLEDTYDIHLH